MDAELGQLDALVERLRAVDQVGAAIATEARARLEAEARATASAGTSPEGESWEPTKKDKRRALPRAADAITAVVSGTTKAVVTLILKAPYVYHQKTRPILPDPKMGLPPRYRAILRDAAARVVARAIGGRS